MVKEKAVPGRFEIFQTVVVLAIAFFAASFIFKAAWALWVTLALLIGGLLESPVTRALALGWMKFGEAIGKVNSKVIVGFLFFFIFTPFAVIYRIFNRTAVEHFTKDTKETYFEPVADTGDAKNFEKVW